MNLAKVFKIKKNEIASGLKPFAMTTPLVIARSASDEAIPKKKGLGIKNMVFKIFKCPRCGKYFDLNEHDECPHCGWR